MKYVMGAGSVASWDFLGPLAPILSPRNPDSRTTIEKDMDGSIMKVQFLIKILLTIVQGAFQTVVILCWVLEKVFAMQSGANELGSILVAKTVPKLRTYSKLNQKK